MRYTNTAQFITVKRAFLYFLLPITPFLATILYSESTRPGGIHEKATFIERANVWVYETSSHQTVWYGDGIKKADGDFVRSQREGYWRFWFTDGKLKAEGSYKNNLRNNHWKLFYENGELKAEGDYAMNRKVGLWKTFYTNRQLESTGHYQDGKKIGLWKNYYESGQLFYTGNYSSNMAHGEFTYYFKNGELYQTGTYERDVRVGKWRVCIFPMGPCDDQFFNRPASPRLTGLPPADAEDAARYSTDNPSALLESLDTGPVPETTPPSLSGNNWE